MFAAMELLKNQRDQEVLCGIFLRQDKIYRGFVIAKVLNVNRGVKTEDLLKLRINKRI